MKIFLDTASINEIKKANETVLLDGVTTNLTLISKENETFENLIRQISQIIHSAICVEVINTRCEEMIQEAKKLSAISKNIKYIRVIQSDEEMGWSSPRLGKCHLRRKH
ncbi:MAG: hypothetical protein L6437_06890 [Kiritimatiellae bacterium]|nr:hypothetical protein [Verrucomicrobiota bacterium]MCG2659952.1 hypothetical protein [Kiritimatiellia bacterium]